MYTNIKVLCTLQVYYKFVSHITIELKKKQIVCIREEWKNVS